MMRYFLTLFWALLAYILTASEASAGPVFVALMANGAAFGAAVSATAVGTFLSTIGGRLLSSVALSALQRALGPKTKQNASGITTSSTATGGTNPVGFVLGSYATAGDAVAPPMTHGQVGKAPNAYLTYVIALGDVAGQSLERVAINGAWVDFLGDAHADYGSNLTGVYTGNAWVKYYDGSQTAADPMLLAKYGSYPERPWLADMIGTGVPYVIFTFRYNREVYSEFPAVLIQCGGIKLYDPRKDSTVGGSGAHRWGQPATYQPSTNPIVMAYNISRGIDIAGLGVWGGEIEAVDLPTASWFSGMNTCDITAGSPAVAQYRAGYEVRVDMEPAAVMEELLKGCAGQIAEVGGAFKVRVGGPGMPVMFLTDDDIVVSKAQDYDPFPQADGRQNGIDAKYPDPAVMWVAKSAPSRYNAAWELEDGERRVVSLDLPACPYPDQVQRIMDAYIADERRFRRHNMTLPPDAAILEPLDVISWTSARNSYTAKQFDLSQLADDVNTALQRVSVREVNAADFVFTGSLIPAPTPSPTPVVAAAQTLASWNVQPLSVGDGAGNPRKPGIVMTWSATDMDAVDAVQYQVRVKDTVIIIKVGTVTEVDGGRIPLTEGIVLGVTYQARAIPIAPGRATAWTAWLDVTAPDTGLTNADFGTTGAYTALFTSQGLFAIRDVTALPGSGAFTGEKVFNRTNGKLYQWTGTVWQLTVANAADGSITTASFAAGIAPVEILGALPTTGNYQGRTIFLTTDKKLYRHTGSPSGSAGFTVATDGADIVANSITAGQIAAGAIGATEIAAEAIVASKILVSDFANIFPDFDLMDSLYYSTADAAAYSFVATGAGSGNLGRRFLSIASNAAAKSVDTGWFQVEANTEYLVSGAAWMSVTSVGGGTSTLTVETGSIDAAGVIAGLTSTVVVARTDIAYGAPQHASVSVITGATARRARFKLTRSAGGTLVGRGGAFKVQKKGTGALTVDGTITGDKIVANTITGGLIAASGIITNSAQINNGLINNAHITGAIQSSVFTAGSVGWKIDKAGNAEFNNLVTRGWIQSGAVSDTVMAVASAEQALDSRTTNVMLIISTGPIGPNELWRCGASLALRCSSPVQVVLEWRRKYAGVWGPWIQKGSQTTTTTYDMEGLSFGISGQYEDTELRLANFATGPFYALYVKSLSITATNVVR